MIRYFTMAILFCAASILSGGCTEKSNASTSDRIPDGAVSLHDYSSYRKGRDWAPAIVQALKENDYVYVPSGNYECSEVSVPAGRTIAGSGSGTVFVALGTTLFSIVGKCDEGRPVASDIADFSNVISLADRTGIGSGDDILVLSQRNSMLREGSPGVNYDTEWVMGRTRRTSVFFGEIDVVSNVSGLTITTENNRVFPSYFSNANREPEPPSDGFIERDATTVHRLEMKDNVVLRDFSISGSTSCYRVLVLKYARDCLLENISFKTMVECFAPDGTPGLSVVHATFCRNVCVKGCSSEFSSSLVDKIWSREKSYANFSVYNIFKIISCWDSGFDGCTSNCATHGFSITRSSSSLGFTSGNCYIRNCISSKNIWSGITVQQGVWKSELSGNVVKESGQGIACAGRSTLIRGNRVSTDLPHDTNYYYTHISSTQSTAGGKVNVFWGGTCGIMLNEGYSCGSGKYRTVVEDNTIQGFYTAIAVRDGYEEKNIFEEGFIDVKSNTSKNVRIGFGVFRNAFNTGKRNLDIVLEGNSFGLADDGADYYISDDVTGIRIIN